jgi:hypothetical protein
MAIEAARAIRNAHPDALLFSSEPAINVVPGSTETRARAATFHDSQYEALDMLLGRVKTHLGGFEDAIDFVGVNYYPHNQWQFGGPTIPFGSSGYRRFRDMLAEIWRRYHKPVVVTETGAEGSARAAWLHYVCDEVRHAMADGVEVAGVCLYPVVDYPGWDNDRHCPVGLFSPPDENGKRATYAPLADELRRQQDLFATFLKVRERQRDVQVQALRNNPGTRRQPKGGMRV